MSTELSPFSRWALDEARTADERYTIWLMCDSARMQEHKILGPLSPQPHARVAPLHVHRELFYNPGLVPTFTAEDTETVARMIPHLRVFPQTGGGGNETRRIRDAGALRWLTALERLALGMTELSDVSFLRALPALEELTIYSGELTDLSPLGDCPGLRRLTLHLTGPGHPSFAPPLHWWDASPLAALQDLEVLELYPNAAVLAGLRFPKVRRAVLCTTFTVQADCAWLPDMPGLRQLKLSGVQSLQGITRFPRLRSLEVDGPLREWGDVAALPELMTLSVAALCGWPRDVTPLAAARELRRVRFTGDMPRNYWPLTAAPKLCALEVQGAKSIELDVQAINPALTPWDEVFAGPSPRPVPPLRLLTGDRARFPRMPETPHPDYEDCPAVFAQELRWMGERVRARLLPLGQDDYTYGRGYSYSDSATQRTFSVQIHSYEAAQRLPEVMDALRDAMAGSPHDWQFSFSIFLRVPRHTWGPDRQRWWDMLQEGWSRDDDDDKSLTEYKMKQQHLIESQFRKRTAEEEGETPDPEDLAPPEEIRPRPYAPAVFVQADPDAEKEKDFALKPFDEQEQNDDSGDDEGGAAVDIDRNPPDWFAEDPESHPLSRSYSLYGLLTFDTFYIDPNCCPTARMLMGRPVEDMPPEQE